AVVAAAGSSTGCRQAREARQDRLDSVDRECTAQSIRSFKLDSPAANWLVLGRVCSGASCVKSTGSGRAQSSGGISAGRTSAMEPMTERKWGGNGCGSGGGMKGRWGRGDTVAPEPLSKARL
ncbi:hypothetical protein Vretimale_1581, partial [Volvox reticuliferus]